MELGRCTNRGRVKGSKDKEPEAFSKAGVGETKERIESYVKFLDAKRLRPTRVVTLSIHRSKKETAWEK